MPTLLDDTETSTGLFANWIDTPLGRMLAVACDKGVVRLDFVEDGDLDEAMARLGPEVTAAESGPVKMDAMHPRLSRLAIELAEYFTGTRTEFSVPLSPRGTRFELMTWRYLRSIPYGQTRSYGQQARAIGEPNASRAVGRANGMNRIGIVIPCHRVIGSDGKLTGYAAGIDRKRWLLEHERDVRGGTLFHQSPG